MRHRCRRHHQRPARPRAAVAAADPNTPEDFDVQGHRGARDLRLENTLPAMEAGLDNLVTTLETDIHLTKDGVPILSHDPHIRTGKCRNADGTPYTFDDEVLIEDLTLPQIRARFICDGVIRTGTPQTNDRALSPVVVAYAQQNGLPARTPSRPCRTCSTSSPSRRRGAHRPAAGTVDRQRVTVAPPSAGPGGDASGRGPSEHD